jgi:hypothetical protein
MEWDNGHFLTGRGATVYFADGDACVPQLDVDVVRESGA